MVSRWLCHCGILSNAQRNSTPSTSSQNTTFPGGDFKKWLNCSFLSICQFVFHNDEQGAQVALVCWRRRRKRHLHWRRRWTAILRQKGKTGQVVLFFGSFFYHFYGSTRSHFLIFYGPLFCVKKVQAFPVLSSLQQKKKNDNVVQVTGGDTVVEDDLTADLFDIRGVSNTNTNSNPTYS